MSFWPLATSLAEALRGAAERGPLIELGAGDGAFAARLRQLDLAVVGIDRRRDALGCAIAADLRHLPLRHQSIGGFVAANALRHLRPAELRRLASEARGSARSGGIFAVLEDDPQAPDAATANYHEALRLLAASDRSRGVLLSRADCEAALRDAWPHVVSSGRGRNELSVQDPQLPLRWLDAHLPPTAAFRARLRALRECVGAEGMSYGDFWYLVLRCP
jgi:hypothetical protein